jgi:hypothetical protein
MEGDLGFLRKIAFFGGQGSKSAFSIDISNAALAYVKTSPVASLLLSACHAAFLEELLSSTAMYRLTTLDELSCYASPESLLTPKDTHKTSPVIQGVSLCLSQLLSYLRHAESESTAAATDLSCANGAMLQWSEVVGFCSGMLPAAAVATSRTIDEYIEASRQIIRLAFWIGFRVSIFCEKLAGPHWRQMPWSMALFGISQDFMERLKDFVSFKFV